MTAASATSAVRDKRGLDLGRPDAAASHLDRVVRSAMNVPVIVRIDAGQIAVHPNAGPPVPIGFEIALWIAPEGMRHTRPGIVHHQFADAISLLAVGIQHVDVLPSSGPENEAGDCGAIV